MIMDDGDLAKYIPCYGDRVALKDKCRNYSTEGTRSKKEKHLKKLREKVANATAKRKRKSSSSEDEGDVPILTKNVGNKHAEKNTRRIELGWMMNLHLPRGETEFKQVRMRTGGGTRHIVVERGTTIIQLLDVAKDLFFPDGHSVRGMADTFEFSIRDFNMKICSNETTVSDIYSVTKMRMLRFYMCTSQKKTTTQFTTTTGDEDVLPDIDVNDFQLFPPCPFVQSEAITYIYTDMGTPTVS